MSSAVGTAVLSTEIRCEIIESLIEWKGNEHVCPTDDMSKLSLVILAEPP